MLLLLAEVLKLELLEFRRADVQVLKVLMVRVEVEAVVEVVVVVVVLQVMVVVAFCAQVDWEVARRGHCETCLRYLAAAALIGSLLSIGAGSALLACELTQ